MKQDLANKILLGSAIGLLVGFLLWFFYFPLGSIFSYSFFSSGTFSWNDIWRTLTSAQEIKAIGFSFSQALLTTGCCILFGLPISFFLAKYDFVGKKFFLNVLCIPFVLPPMVVLLGFIIVFGESGWINTFLANVFQGSFPSFALFGTFGGILLAHVFYNLSVIIRICTPGWQNMDADMLIVAQTLQPRRLKLFFRIYLPQISNYLITAALLVFIYSFNSFAIVLYLGEVIYQTMEVRIYKLMKFNLNFAGGSAMALIQILCNILFLLLYFWFDKKTQMMAEGKERGFLTEPLIQKHRKWQQIQGLFLQFTIFIGVLLFTILPLIAILITSFIPSPMYPHFGDAYMVLFSNEYMPLLGSSPLQTILNSILFASGATFLTFCLSIVICFILRNRYHQIREYRSSIFDRLFSLLIFLPMATSTITFAIGLFLQFHHYTFFMTQGWILIIIAHVMISVPFSIRTIFTAYQQIDVELLNVAATLGVSRLKMFFSVELPLIKQSLIVAILYAFAISIGEFGATSFLARAQYTTLSLGVSKLLSTHSLQLPAAMASILIGITLICFILIQIIGDAHSKRK